MSCHMLVMWRSALGERSGYSDTSRLGRQLWALGKLCCILMTMNEASLTSGVVRKRPRSGSGICSRDECCWISPLASSLSTTKTRKSFSGLTHSVSKETFFTHVKHFGEDMVTLIECNQEKRFFWLLRPFTKVKNKEVAKKLRQQWLPSFERMLGQDARGHVLWGERCKMPAAALEETAHDSTSLVLYLLALFSAQHGTKQVQTYLQSFLCQFLPDKVQLNVKINDCTLHLSLNQGRVSLSELTARTAFRERQKSLRRKITRSMGEERGLADVLVQLFRWNEYKWLFRALLQGLTSELENGIACKQFESTPLESDAFDWSEPDWRDPNVRLARLQAALTTRSRHKKKGQSANEKLSRRQLGQRRAQTAMARSMLTFRHRRQERSQYWQTVRKKFASAVRVHTAFDGSRVGGRKWVTFCVLSGGLACWAPPVRYRDGGYRPADSEQKPNQAEQERLDLRTLEFLEELRSREATAEPTSVVQKVSSALAKVNCFSFGLHTKACYMLARFQMACCVLRTAVLRANHGPGPHLELHTSPHERPVKFPSNRRRSREASPRTSHFVSDS